MYNCGGEWPILSVNGVPEAGVWGWRGRGCGQEGPRLAGARVVRRGRVTEKD